MVINSFVLIIDFGVIVGRDLCCRLWCYAV